MALVPQDRPFAAGAVDRPTRRQTTPQPVQAPRPFWDYVERRAPRDQSRLQERVAREESIVQGALWDRQRQIEALVGHAIPRSMMMTGQPDGAGGGALSEAEYEARIEDLRRQYPRQMAGVETREQLAARLSGRSPIYRYDTDRGPAWVTTTASGAMMLSTADGQTGPLSAFPGARPVTRGPDDPVQVGSGEVAAPRQRSLGERFTTTAEDAANRNPVMALGRLAVGGGYDTFTDEETGETFQYARWGQDVRDYERERRDSYEIMATNDRWDQGDASLGMKALRGLATLGGGVTGSVADPLNALAPGRTAAGRIVGAVAVNTGADVVTQTADIGSGIQDEFNPIQTAAAAIIGGTVQGGAEGGLALARSLRSNPGGVVEALASEIDLGSRLGAAHPVEPAVRAALARVEADKIDADRFGSVDGGVLQDGQLSLDQQRRPVPAAPTRDLEQLFDTPVSDGLGAASAGVGGRTVGRQSLDPMTLQADPARFQYEGGTDLSAATGWDTDAAGSATVWQDRAGSMLVADGFQRAGLARRLVESGQEPDVRLDSFVFRQADGWTADEVRGIAALRNIRGGRGNPLDAARLMRSSPDLLNDPSLPIDDGFLTTARGLARLGDDAFASVADGRLSPELGSLVGQMAGGRPDLQGQMIEALGTAKPKSPDTARAIVQEVRNIDALTDLGLADDVLQGLQPGEVAIGRGRLRAEVLAVIRKDAALMDALLSGADALDAGGYALGRTDADRAAGDALAATAAVEKFALASSAFGDPFSANAAALVRGEVSLKKAGAAVVRDLKALAREVEDAAATRAALLNPSAPSPAARQLVLPFDEPGGVGRRAQATPKPEDAAREIEDAARWDDLPEVGEEQRALDVLRICAPGGW